MHALSLPLVWIHIASLLEWALAIVGDHLYWGERRYEPQWRLDRPAMLRHLVSAIGRPAPGHLFDNPDALKATCGCAGLHHPDWAFGRSPPRLDLLAAEPSHEPAFQLDRASPAWNLGSETCGPSVLIFRCFPTLAFLLAGRGLCGRMATLALRGIPVHLGVRGRDDRGPAVVADSASAAGALHVDRPPRRRRMLLTSGNS